MSGPVSQALRRTSGPALLLAALALAGCAGPRFVPNPESGIELRWPNGQGTIEEAQAAAQTRCAPNRAMLAGEFVDRDETLARFYCR